jgi:cytochrome c peroxidase
VRKALVISCLLAVVALLSFKSGRLQFAIPKGWPKPVYDFAKNPLSQQKIDLGSMLFYDPILSRDSTTSCASCHSQYNAFTHVDHDLSHGIENRIGTRNSPALMNLAWGSSFMWDGAVNHLDVQSLAPITNPLEMDETLPNVIRKLQSSKRYTAMFYKAYGDSVITGERLLKSLSQFMLTLVSSNAKYDSVMRKQAVFTEQETKGYTLYKQHCASCHAEPLFTNNSFENNGLYVDNTLNDKGRMAISKNKTDSLKFKVPTLRNLKYSYPYMHDGRFKHLGQVLNHYAMGIQRTPTLASQLQKGIFLNNEEKFLLLAFLGTLNDKSFVSNPSYGYPKKNFEPNEGL